MKNIRKIKIFFPFIASFLLVACSTGMNNESPYSARQMAEVIISAQPGYALSLSLLPEDSDFVGYLSNVYQIDSSILEDGAVYYAGGAQAGEIAVFLIADSADVKNTKEKLDEYKDRRAAAFTGYAPNEAALVEDSVIVTRGNYTALLICENPQEAEKTFLSCFSKNPPKLTDIIIEGSQYIEASEENNDTEENLENDPYDSQSILNAWRTGDLSALTSKNRQVFNVCAEEIGRLIKDDMTDYEKELTLHNWLVKEAKYDEEAISNAPDAKPDPDNENPYGLLIKQKATCKGYSSTFQLLMDMAKIDCITVDGTAHAEAKKPHSWNMVRLDGEWYCVDVTWDDPVGLILTNTFMNHQFFNVTSQFLRDNGHRWDETAVPEATATKYQWPDAKLFNP